MTRHVLIIGGTGVFGKRLVRHLANFDGITLFVSSRSAVKAQAFIDTLVKSRAVLQAVALDCGQNLQDQLNTIQPFIVVDCSGPFQGASYDTARVIIRSGAHFIDLADARDYLVNFASTLDGEAKLQNVSALTGASSTPTLSTCVATHLTQGWHRVDTVDICITPGGKSDVGRSVIEAIMSYAGRDVPVWILGQLSQITGWGGAQNVEIPQLGKRRVAAVETFDAEYLGPHLNVQSRVSFSAGLESKIEQTGMEVLAALHKLGVIKSPQKLIPLLLRARKVTRIFTSDAGGMLVGICGIDAGGIPTQTRWSLVARQDHGPFIPILPAAAAVRKLLDGDILIGAGLAHSILSLPDILAQMTLYDIATQTSLNQTTLSVFENALGPDVFGMLPNAVQNFHQATGPTVWSGMADIVSGRSVMSKVLGRVFGFPRAGRDIPLTVNIDRTISRDGIPMERWTRLFTGAKMSSVLQYDSVGAVTEAFTPFIFTLPLAADAGGISMPVSAWRIGKIALPKWLAPRSEAREFMDDQGRFWFDVKLSAPLIGLIAHYRGWLEPKTF
ncbi:MAG: saccharopine dehydrogenase-like NADP-dependent oxidoreductase [Yoonia sp.]|jgi:saccharopine dehydrogenase-like NADP-dependent oxidoreductase